MYIFGLICCTGLMLLGISFAAVLLAQWIPLRPDVMCGFALASMLSVLKMEGELEDE